MDGCFHFHASLVRSAKPRAFEREHGDLGAVPTKTKFAALAAQATIAIEEFIAFEAAGMRFGTEPKQARPDRADVGDPVLLFALYIATGDGLLELARQVFFEFTCCHEYESAKLTTPGNPLSSMPVAGA